MYNIIDRNYFNCLKKNLIYLNYSFNTPSYTDLFRFRKLQSGSGDQILNFSKIRFLLKKDIGILLLLINIRQNHVSKHEFS